MAIGQVRQVDQNRVRDTQVTEEVQRRLHLFTHSKLEANRQTFAGIGKPDLSALKSSTQDDRQRTQAQESEAETQQVRIGSKTLDLPVMNSSDRARVEFLLAASADHRADLERRLEDAGRATYVEVVQNPSGVQLGSYSENLEQAAGGLMDGFEEWILGHGAIGNDNATSDLALLGIEGVQRNLYSVFQKAQDEDKLGQELRTDLADLDAMLADWPEGGTETVSYHELKQNPDGSYSLVLHENVELTKDEAIALKSKLEGQVESLGQVNQKSMMFLQMYVEKYQQAMNVVSNILKNVDETRKGIIQNVKA